MAETQLLWFRADFCPHCRAMEKQGVLRDLQRTAPELTVVIEDLSDGLTPLAEAFNVRTIPAFVLVDEDGKVLRRTSGAKTAAELARWAQPSAA
jgi:thiol-disulfide isomerase/thioredoxin